MAVAPLAQPLQVVVVGDDNARLALHRLHHYGGGAVGGGADHGLDVVVVNVDEARQQRSEILLVVGLPGGRHGRLGPPVEGVECGDDLVGPVPVQLAVAPRQLHCPLDRLGAAVPEEHEVQAAVFDQRLGQLQLRYGVELVRGLDQRAGLLGYGLGQHRVAVPQLVYRPARDEVQVLLAVCVPDLGPLSTHDDHRLAPHGLGVVLLLNVNPVAADAHGESSSPDRP